MGEGGPRRKEFRGLAWLALGNEGTGKDSIRKKEIRLGEARSQRTCYPALRYPCFTNGGTVHNEGGCFTATSGICSQTLESLRPSIQMCSGF